MSAGCDDHSRAAEPRDDKPLTRKELAKALLRDSDVPGLSADVGPGLPLFDQDDVVTASPPTCQPLADMMSVRPRHPRTALVWEVLDGVRGAGGKTSGSVTLSSHRTAEAQEWMADLAKALPPAAPSRPLPPPVGTTPSPCRRSHRSRRAISRCPT
ncbi:hypothetical protein E4K10_43395 [Streptomyces sp. T1317-0309]|nr:hypothetical protein E4K10_43395 [Streptomyces sp. T1317-0309]